jgi:hypothetical protein
MESPHSSQQAPASTNAFQFEAFRTQIRWLLANVTVPQTPLLEEHPAYRTKKSPRLSFRLFGNRNSTSAVQTNVLPTHTDPRLASADPATTHFASPPEASHGLPPRSQSQNSSNRNFQPRLPRLNRAATALNARRSRGRRQYAWVRRSRRKRGLFGLRGPAFRSALKSQAVKRSVFRCVGTGFLLVIVLSVCMKLPPMFP